MGEITTAVLNLTKVESLTGSNVVIIVGPTPGVDEVAALLTSISDLELWKFTGVDPKAEQIEDITEELISAATAANLRRLTLLGIDWGGSVVVQYCSDQPRNMRRALFWNARARLRRTSMDRVVEWIEQYLPLGLPLRPLSKAFDPRPILHRVRCPALVIVEESSDESLIAESEFLGARIPNAWVKKIKIQNLAAEFEEFLEVPTKQPQKNLRAGNGRGEG